MNSCLVTGGAGFIGSYVVKELQDRVGLEPIIFDRRTTNLHGDVERFYGDIRDRTAVTDAVAHADAVIHVAGVLGTQETIADPRPAAEVNIAGGLNVLDAVKRYEVPLVYIAVGNHWMDNSYSITKTCMERFCRMFRNEHDLDIAVVRAMNAYGPGQVPAAPYGPSKVRKIMPAFVCRALAGDPIEVYGDGSQVMDMVYVSDVASCLVEAIGTRCDVEVGTGVPTTVNDIAYAVLEEAGCGSVVHLPMRPGEPEHSTVLADPEPLWSSLGIDADEFVQLDEGVAHTVDWYAEHWLPGYRP